jgi:hypothetical protein
MILSDRPNARLIPKALPMGYSSRVHAPHRLRSAACFENSAAPCHLTNSSRHVVASRARCQQKKRVIRIHRNTIAKPANAAVGNELMHAAVDRNAKRIAQKPRSPWSLSSDCSATRPYASSATMAATAERQRYCRNPSRTISSESLRCEQTGLPPPDQSLRPINALKTPAPGLR